MIRYINDLFLTENTQKNLEKIKRKLRLGTGMSGLYFILLSSNEKDVFDIVPAPVFKQRRFRHRDHIVVGISESMDEVYNMVGSIVSDHYLRTGSYTGLKKDFMECYLNSDTKK
ncbi:MAG: hypothetical protein K6E98_08145 [Lachnospiraceae bacterium]|nr:hypothetical protein [Lachnospiraceae bacterium]